MGITGLLPIVKKIMKRKHISKYCNKRIGIDGHAWAHQIIPMIASDLYYGKPTTKHADVFMSKVSTLLIYSITPIIVFDGDFLISKEKTCVKRKEQKEKARKIVEILLEQNEHSKAREYMKRCVSVTPDVLKPILNILQANKIEYLISPYEADAQLHFLQKLNYIDFIMTEDSDLISHGAKKILYKFSGSHVDEYNSEYLHLCKDTFFNENILDISILSGCDYLDSIKGVGLITAHKKLKEIGTIDGFIYYMSAIGKEIPEDYLEKYRNARISFLHHIVYNPLSRSRQYLNESDEDYYFLGTLENIPFKCGNLVFDRHFTPNFSKSSLDIEKSKEKQLLTHFDMDSDLSISPYFK